MKKNIYLILSIETSEFAEIAKNGYKIKDMVYKTKQVPVYADKNKEDAIRDCRRHNNEQKRKTYFYIEMNLF